MRRNIYEGPSSCYAIKEGIYVVGRKVNLATAVAIAKLILRDFRRGWTYDHQCRRIPMTPTLFRKRLFYLIALAKKHGAPKHEVKLIRKLVNYVYRHHAIQSWLERESAPILTKRKVIKLIEKYGPEALTRRVRPKKIRVRRKVPALLRYYS